MVFLVVVLLLVVVLWCTMLPYGVHGWGRGYDAHVFHTEEFRMKKMPSIEEFMQREKPMARQSRLDKFKVQIFELRESGYSFEQIAKYLSECDVTISVEGVRKYVNRHESNQRRNTDRQPASRPESENAGAEVASDNAAESDLSARQRREKHASKFVDTAATNPLINRIKEKQ